MVVSRRWRVISGTMAAGAILVPATASALDGLPSLQDVVPYVSESPTTEDATFYQNLTNGLPVTLDLESVLTFDDESVASLASELSALSEPSTPSEPSEPSVPSEPSEPSIDSEASEPSAPSEPSEPSAPSEPSEPSIDSEPSADDSI